MFWKIYAWIYVLVILAGSLLLVPTIGSWNLASWEGAIESILLAIGVFVFAYKKELFNRKIWKFIFIIILAIWIGDIVFYTTKLSYLGFLETSIPASTSEALFSILFSVPALVAIYKMGFTKKV
ncbi:MAG: hypothetical protein WD231_03020 [Candidatus Woykebacteria bacterium]